MTDSDSYPFDDDFDDAGLLSAVQDAEAAKRQRVDSSLLPNWPQNAAPIITELPQTPVHRGQTKVARPRSDGRSMTSSALQSETSTLPVQNEQSVVLRGNMQSAQVSRPPDNRALVVPHPNAALPVPPQPISQGNSYIVTDPQMQLLPSTSHQQPSNSNQQPSISYQQPVIPYQQPLIPYQQPSTSYQQPSISYQQPSTSYQQPSTSYQQPSTSYQQPPAGNQRQPLRSLPENSPALALVHRENTERSQSEAKEPAQAAKKVQPWIDCPRASVFRSFQDEAMMILDPADYQMLQGKRMIKKTGWRKLGMFFGINYEIKDFRDETDQDGNITRSKFWVKAIMPNGRYCEATGSCDTNEKRFSKPNNDVPATAETRAKTRAVQDLLGIGEWKSHQ